MSVLVIVESPAKAKTISRVLGKGYQVEASYGHVRDLPANAEQIPAKVKKEAWSRLGVNVEENFEPLYIVPPDKKKYVKRLKEALAGADTLLLATDEDREGESISWHVVQLLGPKVAVQRIAFHEITAEAIRAALASPRDIDERLVRAQESRRILDRLFGYLLSPVLWRKVRRGLSAGRVQSVAVRLTVLRERERKAFRSARYFDAEADFEVKGHRFTARLARLGGRPLARGQDFDGANGKLREGVDVNWLADQEQVTGLIEHLERPWKVTKVEKKPFTRKPAPPFTTSTLQQEANRKLGFSAQRTMRVAQRLYEGIDLGDERVGLITYMRTDSVTLAERALDETRVAILELYGDEYTDGPRRYKTKSAGAQEAHEAIRPTELARTPEALAASLDADERRIYELIWKRTMASQMSDARLERTAVEIEATVEGEGPGPAIFAVSGRTVRFPGFLRAYVEGSDDPAAEVAERELVLPALEPEQACDPLRVESKIHETAPPARYTEASLVKKLEAEGIGRPSTYAMITETIQQRGYVFKQHNALIPTFTAFAVTQLLEEHFGDYVDTTFTARMERELDEIADGRSDPRNQLRRMYYGDGADQRGLVDTIQAEEGSIEYPEVAIGEHPRTGAPVVVKVGRYGPYVQAGTDGDRVMASLPQGVAPADFSIDEAVVLLDRKAQGPRELGTDPDSGNRVYVAHGRYGAWVQLGETPTDPKADKPKRSSLPKGMTEDEATLQLALKLLSLPRTVGPHPDSGEPVLATRGRYGPHLRCGTETRSLESEEQVFEITLDEAVAKLNEPRKGRRGRGGVRKVLKELGADPDSGSAVQLLDGPYGNYLTNGELNASLPDGVTADTVTLEQAVEILASRGKAPRRKAAKAAKTTKKTAKKKTAKKKTSDE